ncbi:EamA family transporter [Aeromicrobium sp.]|uniref:EamA family transporter n=1 Tax=Aeromicrobium sp. TaxID=1871063 RepID=UPI003D6BA6F2
MAIVLALLSALAYGISDFLGGIFSRKASPWQVAVVAQLSSTTFNALAALVVGGSPEASDWRWGVLAGLSAGIGAVFLYRGLANARMGVVAPLSAVGCALVPVIVGLSTGDRPSTLAVIGIICAFPAMYLISLVVDEDPTHRGGVIDGILAGLGFGLLFVFIGQMSDDAGLMPLALAQAFAVLGVIALAVALRQPFVPRTREPWRAVVMGPLGATATGAFLYATHHGLLSVVAVIAALYPAGTVLLATILLRERIHAWQGVGLAFAVAAVTLVAVG